MVLVLFSVAIEAEYADTMAADIKLGFSEQSVATPGGTPRWAGTEVESRCRLCGQLTSGNRKETVLLSTTVRSETRPRNVATHFYIKIN